jgi:hypothetical protein
MFSAVYDNEQPIMLLHEFDTVTTHGHFDLLIHKNDENDHLSQEQFHTKSRQTATCSASFSEFLQISQSGEHAATNTSVNSDGKLLDNASKIDESMLNAVRPIVNMMSDMDKDYTGYAKL